MKEIGAKYNLDIQERIFTIPVRPRNEQWCEFLAPQR